MDTRKCNETSILILFRADSIRRLYNLVAVVESLTSLNGVNIYVREADCVNHHIAQKLLPPSVKYEFTTDKDSVLHKTRHFNQMLEQVSTPYVGIWDTDTIAYSTSVTECIDALTNGKALMALPYNGICLDTSVAIADIYMQSSDFRILDTYSYLMARLQPQRLTGGAVLMNRNAFLTLGGENENYYGWGDDDYDRYVRFYQSGASIFRSKKPLFHLSHPRGENSGFSSSTFAVASKVELSRTASHKR